MDLCYIGKKGSVNITNCRGKMWFYLLAVPTVWDFGQGFAGQKDPAIPWSCGGGGYK